MLGLLIAAYLQFVIMLGELKKGLGIKRSVCVARILQSVRMDRTKMYDVALLHVYCIINK